jgi:hypothetical protein
MGTAFMKRFASAALLSAVFVTAAYSQVPAPPPLSSDFDGKWSVLIVTEQGTCDRAYRYPLVIEGGNVQYGGKKNFTVSGEVKKGGAVVVSVMQGTQGAQGTGKMQGQYGAGTWVAPSGGCSGRWKAEKRG